MRISAKAEYACLAVIELARTGVDGTPRRVRDIAEAQGIPERYLVQILLQLKAAGLVHSSRGSDGGYVLSKSPREFTVADVISCIDGPGEPVRKSSTDSAARLRDLIERARIAQLSVLARETVADIAESAAANDWVL